MGSVKTKIDTALFSPTSCYLPNSTLKIARLCIIKNSSLKINNIKQLSKFTPIITCIPLKYFVSLQIKILIHTNNESETICQMGRR